MLMRLKQLSLPNSDQALAGRAITLKGTKMFFANCQRNAGAYTLAVPTFRPMKSLKYLGAVRMSVK